jgi:exportin-7
MLARLAFKPVHLHNFDTFVEELDRMFLFLNQQANIRSEPVLQTLPTLCRFLTGILEGAMTIPAYLLVFDWLHPQYLPLMLRTIEASWDLPEIAVPILSFYAEFVHNKSQRITFPSSSPNSILLFKETSKIVCMYGANVLRTHDDSDDTSTDEFYQSRLQGISLVFKIMTHALSGNYVNFGVFDLYNDVSLTLALRTSLNLILNLPLHTAFAYPDIMTQYYSLMEVLFKHHLEIVASHDSKTFFSLVNVLHEGLTSFEVVNSSKCASALDALFSAKFNLMRTSTSRKKNPPSLIAKLDTHFEPRQQIIVVKILSTLFNMVIFDNVPNTWSLARPILSICVAFPQCLAEYQKLLVSMQNEAAQRRLPEAFAELVAAVTPYANTHSSSSKVVPSPRWETFVMALNKFVRQVSGYCVRPMW